GGSRSIGAAIARRLAADGAEAWRRYRPTYTRSSIAFLEKNSSPTPIGMASTVPCGCYRFLTDSPLVRPPTPPEVPRPTEKRRRGQFGLSVCQVFEKTEDLCC